MDLISKRERGNNYRYQYYDNDCYYGYFVHRQILAIFPFGSLEKMNQHTVTKSKYICFILRFNTTFLKKLG